MKNSFYTDLGALAKPPTKHSEMFILGDLNARLGKVLSGEEETIGPHVFTAPITVAQHVTSNRELLLEQCMARDYIIANTFFDLTDDKQQRA